MADPLFYQQLLQQMLSLPPPGDEPAAPQQQQAAPAKQQQFKTIKELQAAIGEDGIKRMYPGGLQKYIVGGTLQEPLVMWPPPQAPQPQGLAAKAAPKAAPVKQMSPEDAAIAFRKMLAEAGQTMKGNAVAPTTPDIQVQGVQDAGTR